MEYNHFNHLSTYESVFIKLKTILNEFLENVEPTYLKNFYFNPKAKNHNRQSNRLIEIDINPDELKCRLKSIYLCRASIKGEIGMVNSKLQYNGIINIALYMLISNRLAKWYKYEKIKNPSVKESEKASYKDKYAQYKSEKNEATIKLLYSLFIYKETVDSNTFFYGHYLDNRNRHTLIIDLPKYGQIGVHFGSKDNFEYVMHLAKENIKLILKEKLQLGQITEIKFKVLISKVNADFILPEYSGKFYEQFVPSIPIIYYGKSFKKAEIDLGLKTKKVCAIDEKFIEKMCRNNYYNGRELYYLGIKLGFSKSQLELLSQHLKERSQQLLSTSKKQKTVDVSSLVKEAFPSTNSVSRRKVSSHERRCDNNIKVINNVR